MIIYNQEYIIYSNVIIFFVFTIILEFDLIVEY